MHHHQYMSPLTGSSSSSNTGSPTGAAVTANLPLIASIANVKDSRWLTLEVCREYQRGKCTRADQECKFAHPPSHVEVNSGKVIACFDSLKGKCNRTNPPCKYLHPPQHLRDILLQNGRNNLILRSIAMNIAANQSIYPQTGAHVSYPNGAILSNPLQAAGSLTSYPQLAQAAAPAQSTIVFNQAGQAFTIPLSTLPSTAATAMYAPDGNTYFSPVTQFAGQPTGPKAIRTDRLESYIELDSFYQQSGGLEEDSAYVNGYLPAYQSYTGQIQAIYARNPSIDVKDTSLSNSTNTSASADLTTSTNSTVTEIKAVIDPVSSAGSITQQTKKRPLEDDTATTGAYLQLQPGQQILTTAPCVQPTSNGPSINGAPQQKRSAIADPTTGIPMAAYPVTTFPYASPSPLQIPFQGQYFTAVPMTFTGYAPHLPRL